MALTPNQERFAQEVAKGANQTDAYRLAYDCSRMQPATVHGHASELARDGEVLGRIRVLKEAATRSVVEEIKYDLKDALLDAQSAIEFAKEKGNPASVVSAMALKAKLAGLLVDKKEVRSGPLDDLDVEELKRMRDQLLAQRAEPSIADQADAALTAARPPHQEVITRAVQ